MSFQDANGAGSSSSSAVARVAAAAGLDLAEVAAAFDAETVLIALAMIVAVIAFGACVAVCWIRLGRRLMPSSRLLTPPRLEGEEEEEDDDEEEDEEESAKNGSRMHRLGEQLGGKRRKGHSKLRTSAADVEGEPLPVEIALPGEALYPSVDDDRVMLD